jgi:hypothetical protein
VAGSVTPPPGLATTLLTALAANGAALAVSFGVGLNDRQIVLIEAVVGGLSALGSLLVAALHHTHVTAAVKLAAAPSTAATPPAGGTAAG